MIISAHSIGKRYTIRHQHTDRYQTLRQAMANGFSRGLRALLKRPVESARSTVEDFWALRDASFEVAAGDRIGIIGRNGAGKSTLLKILSRITRPTEGRVVLRGRVASLLEVGTGFHPELTGRENIFLNGAILGMTRDDIRKQFDAIVDFADVENFLDTPVKRYSSGMYVRLAFAVAAHLEPDILLVDEVLAVGDTHFQKKCIGKMHSAGQEGRTLIFISHNMGVVQSLCNKGLLLSEGRIIREGAVEDVILDYLKPSERSLNHCYRLTAPAEHPEAAAYLSEASILNAEGSSTFNFLHFGEPFAVYLKWQNSQNLKGLNYYIRCFDHLNRLIFAVNTIQIETISRELPGSHEIVCRFPTNLLKPGTYHFTIGAWIRPNISIWKSREVLSMTIENHPFTPDRPFYHATPDAIIHVPSTWHEYGTND